MRKTAEKYSQNNFSCLPVKDDKSPNVKGTWKEGITDLSMFDNAYGIGIICGEKSKGLECLDFDNHQGDAKENLKNFVEEISDLKEKYTFTIEKTQSGGYHFLYRCSKIQGNLKLASRPMLDEKTNKWKPDAIIETRGEGGYFVCDPTPGYKIIRGSLEEIPEIEPEERDRIISVCKSFNEWYEVRKESYEETDKPGDRYNQTPEAIDDMKNVLKENGWKELKKGIWQRSGKNKGISATIGKVAENVFYNFSSNAYPFEPNAGYTPFQVVGLLKYKGDFKTLAKELAEKYGDKKLSKKEEVKKEKSKDELDKILDNSYIDLNVPVPKPPIILTIKEFAKGSILEKRLFTLGNFSAVTGKSKSKKTMLTSVMLAAAAKNGGVYNKIIGNLPEDKPGVLLFDTEQSRYDSYVTAKRVWNILGEKHENFGAFDLREYDPLERCQIIGYALKKYEGEIGYVVIDGIVDLGTAINDEDEANRVVSLLMKWTKIYNVHITNVIHQNKNDNWATGHIGSAILKKAEAIISVTKDPDDPYISSVECSMIRGTADFEPFDIEINEEGIPKITDMLNIMNDYNQIDLT